MTNLDSDQREQTRRDAPKGICAKCLTATETKEGTHRRFGRFLHVKCFDAWWRSEYEQTGGPYYNWMRQGMCVR